MIGAAAAAVVVVVAAAATVVAAAAAAVATAVAAELDQGVGPEALRIVHEVPMAEIQRARVLVLQHVLVRARHALSEHLGGLAQGVHVAI